MILFIKHIDIEGPETIGEFFRKQGYACTTVDLSRGEALPQNFSELEAVICLGGPMNVYEEDKYPFLKAENGFIREIVQRRIPYLGICLGAQLLAKACEARVTQSPVQEIGWFSVALTPDGKIDPLFKGLQDSLEIFQWHGDTFAVPAGGKLLVQGDTCRHQAIKVGPCAYGLQFHIEITDKSIREWSEEYFRSDPPKLVARKTRMLADYEEKKSAFHHTAGNVYKNFLELVAEKNYAAKKF